jgi:hypothetical protein
MECNDFIFHKKCYQQEKLQSLVWEAFLDYVKLKWSRTLAKICTFLNWNMTILIYLIESWGGQFLFYNRDYLDVRWSYCLPKMGKFLQCLVGM